VVEIARTEIYADMKVLTSFQGLHAHIFRFITTTLRMPCKKQSRAQRRRTQNRQANAVAKRQEANIAFAAAVEAQNAADDAARVAVAAAAVSANAAAVATAARQTASAAVEAAETAEKLVADEGEYLNQPR
jgi:hypothetical protein